MSDPAIQDSGSFIKDRETSSKDFIPLAIAFLLGTGSLVASDALYSDQGSLSKGKVPHGEAIEAPYHLEPLLAVSDPLRLEQLRPQTMADIAKYTPGEAKNLQFQPHQEGIFLNGNPNSVEAFSKLFKNKQKKTFGNTMEELGLRLVDSHGNTVAQCQISSESGFSAEFMERLNLANYEIGNSNLAGKLDEKTAIQQVANICKVTPERVGEVIDSLKQQKVTLQVSHKHVQLGQAPASAAQPRTVKVSDVSYDGARVSPRSATPEL